MCKECGCGGELSHESHGHGMDVHVPVLDANDRLAERNRGFFAAKNLLVINVFSSPGSGKTSLLQKTAEMLRGRVRIGVIVGDLATDNDAERLSRADIPVVQITTGTMCHLDARMIAEAMKKMPLDDLDVLIIENVGNLVCPASYDLGEGVRVVLLSVTADGRQSDRLFLIPRIPDGGRISDALRRRAGSRRRSVSVFRGCFSEGRREGRSMVHAGGVFPEPAVGARCSC